MQQLLSCVSLTGNPCCEYPYSLSGADCVRQCLENYYASILNQKDTDWFVASKFGIQDAECLSSRKILDIKRLIDLLVILFEEAENRVINGLTPLSMSEIWEENGLRCIVTSMRRKYGLNLVNAFAMAGITDPVGNPVPTNTIIPVPGSYSCGIGPAPDPDGPEPPDPSCFINADDTAIPLDCNVAIDAVFVTGVEVTDISDGLYIPGNDVPGYEGMPFYWLNGIPLYGQAAPTPGEYYWNISLGDGFTTFPVSSSTPWENDNWYDTFGTGSIVPEIRQGTNADACGVDIIIVSGSGEPDTNGLYISGPTILTAIAGTTTYYKGDRFIYAETEVSGEYTWVIAQGSVSNIRYRSVLSVVPEGVVWTIQDGTGPAPDVTEGSLFDLLVPPPLDDEIYSITCCDEPYFATYDSLNSEWNIFTFPPDFILQSDGILYTDVGNGPGMLFPSVSLSLVGPGPTSYYLESNAPQTSQGRDVRVLGLINGTWTEIWSGNEDQLPQNIEIIGSIPTQSRAIYTIGACEYESQATLTTPPPGGCGAITISILQEDDCLGAQFSLELSISGVLAFPLGDIVIRDYGIEIDRFAATEGIQTLGPFPSAMSITVEVENAAFPACSVLSNRYSSNCGVVDPEFANANLNGPVLETRIQSDQSILVAGTFSAYGTTPANRLTRLLPNGDLDVAFNLNVTPTALGGFDNRVDRIEVASDGKIYCAGFFRNLNGTPVGNICRLNANGTLDVTFNTGSGFNGIFISDILLRPDGTLICIGDFTSYNGFAVNRIVSLNPNGSIDGTFNPGTGLNNYANRLAIDNSGNILVATLIGSTYNGNVVKTGTSSIFRILPNGTYVGNIVTGTQFDGSVLDMSVQIDNKIVIVGAFTDLNGTSANRIIRLNSDFTVDANFLANIGSGSNGILYDVNIMSNGQMLIGCFSGSNDFNGSATGLLIRLNSNGTRDISFNNGVGFNATVYDTAIDPVNGSVIAVGNFVTLDALPRVRVARLI